MSHAAPNAAAAAGRVLMSIIFLQSGFQNIARVSGTAAYMASQGLPAPDLAALVAIVVEGIGRLARSDRLSDPRCRAGPCSLGLARALIGHTNLAVPTR